MIDPKTEFELMKEDVMLYLALFFRQRGLEEDDDILDQIKAINKRSFQLLLENRDLRILFQILL